MEKMNVTQSANGCKGDMVTWFKVRIYVFGDIGNTWLYRSNLRRPSNFQWKILSFQLADIYWNWQFTYM